MNLRESIESETNPVSAGWPFPPNGTSMPYRNRRWRCTSWALMAFTDCSIPANLCCTLNTPLAETVETTINKMKRKNPQIEGLRSISSPVFSSVFVFQLFWSLKTWVTAWQTNWMLFGRWKQWNRDEWTEKGKEKHRNRQSVRLSTANSSNNRHSCFPTSLSLSMCFISFSSPALKYYSYKITLSRALWLR